MTKPETGTPEQIVVHHRGLSRSYYGGQLFFDVGLFGTYLFPSGESRRVRVLGHFERRRGKKGPESLVVGLVGNPSTKPPSDLAAALFVAPASGGLTIHTRNPATAPAPCWPVKLIADDAVPPGSLDGTTDEASSRDSASAYPLPLASRMWTATVNDKPVTLLSLLFPIELELGNGQDFVAPLLGSAITDQGKLYSGPVKVIDKGLAAIP